MAEDRKIDVTQTPEFKAAVEQMRKETAETIANALAKAGGNPTTSSNIAFAESLAMAIASLTDQDSGRVHIAPEVLRKRSEARERMTHLIVEARAKGKVPAYTLTSVCYLDGRLIKPKWVGGDHIERDTEVDWLGVPNEAMIPLNETAQAIFVAFSESIGGPAEHNGILDANNALLRKGEAQHSVSGVSVRNVDKDQPTRMWNEGRPIEEGGVRLRHQKQADPTQIKRINVLGKTMPPATQSA